MITKSRDIVPTETTKNDTPKPQRGEIRLSGGYSSFYATLSGYALVSFLVIVRFSHGWFIFLLRRKPSENNTPFQQMIQSNFRGLKKFLMFTAFLNKKDSWGLSFFLQKLHLFEKFKYEYLYHIKLFFLSDLLHVISFLINCSNNIRDD